MSSCRAEKPGSSEHNNREGVCIEIETHVCNADNGVFKRSIVM